MIIKKSIVQKKNLDDEKNQIHIGKYQEEDILKEDFNCENYLRESIDSLTELLIKANFPLMFLDGKGGIKNIDGDFDYNKIKRIFEDLFDSLFCESVNSAGSETSFFTNRSIKDNDRSESKDGAIFISFGNKPKTPKGDLSDPEVIDRVLSYLKKQKTPVTLYKIQKAIRKYRLTIREIANIVCNYGYQIYSVSEPYNKIKYNCIVKKNTSFVVDRDFLFE